MASRLVLLLLVIVFAAGCGSKDDDQAGVVTKQPSGADAMKERGMSQEEIDSRAKQPH